MVRGLVLVSEVLHYVLRCHGRIIAGKNKCAIPIAINFAASILDSLATETGEMEDEMSTRSVAHYYDGETLLCTVYRHHDGYPSGRGSELAEFLSGRRLVNGISLADRESEIFNGAGSMAAACIAHEVGEGHSIRMMPPGSTPRDAEYVYEIHADTMNLAQGIRFVCRDTYSDGTLFDGSPKDFDARAIESAA